jgi:hypothetical protein
MTMMMMVVVVVVVVSWFQDLRFIKNLCYEL